MRSEKRKVVEITHQEKLGYLKSLEDIVAEVGKQILAHNLTEIADTHDYKGHESSNIDFVGRERMQAAIDRYLPMFEGTVRMELNPYNKQMIEEKSHFPMSLIIDEIEGTTNTKRCFASMFKYRPLSMVSMALSLSDSLKDLIISAIYTFDQGEVYSSIRVEDTFMSFYNTQLQHPEEFSEKKGDSKDRVLVAGYSNSHRMKKGELEQSLYDAKFKTYEGCRASGMDVINILRNQTDAYIDLRAYCSTKDCDGDEKEAMLQVYDIAGMIPIAEGCGLVVTDAEGKSWKDYSLEDTMPLVVARPSIHERVIKITKEFAAKWKAN